MGNSGILDLHSCFRVTFGAVRLFCNVQEWMIQMKTNVALTHVCNYDLGAMDGVYGH